MCGTSLRKHVAKTNSKIVNASNKTNEAINILCHVASYAIPSKTINTEGCYIFIHEIELTYQITEHIAFLVLNEINEMKCPFSKHPQDIRIVLSLPYLTKSNGVTIYLINKISRVLRLSDQVHIDSSVRVYV